MLWPWLLVATSSSVVDVVVVAVVAAAVVVVVVVVVVLVGPSVARSLLFWFCFGSHLKGVATAHSQGRAAEAPVEHKSTKGLKNIDDYMLDNFVRTSAG